MNHLYSNKSELRQALLELHYDLLDEAEAHALRAAIESNAEVAGEWAITLQLAGKMASAAKLPESAAATISAASTTHVSSQVAPSRQRVWAAPTIVAAIAASLGFLLIGYRNVQRIPSAPRPAVRIEANLVSTNAPDNSNEFRVVTSRVDGTAIRTGRFPLTPAIISFSVMAKSEVLLRGTMQTDSSGTGKITLPPELVIPNDAKLNVTAKSADGELDSTSVTVPLEPTRCLTYLTVDRPVYRPGENVYFRSLTLERSSLRPLVEVPIRYEIIDPSGAVVPGLFSEGVSNRGVGNGMFMIPSAAPGGTYTLVARSLDGFFPDEKREFEVRVYRVPRFKTKLEFDKRSYGPGDTVHATFTAERAEGGVLADTSLRIVAKVDDTIVHEQMTSTTALGECSIAFHLPTLIKNGVGHLSVVVDDGATQETQTKTIPIQLGRVAVEFFPEGGYLVDGLLNRVYFTARDTLETPIHMAGEVQTRAGERVASIETTRDGMGRFEFTPKQGERYTLKITSPADVTDLPSLPTVVKDLPVIDTGVGVFDADQPLAMVIRSAASQAVTVQAVCRGKLVASQNITLSAGETTVSLALADAGGVIRVTVLDAETSPAKPLVERLVYQRQEKQLNVEIVDTDQGLERSPGEPIRLTLQVRDESGEPTPAVLGIAVVDEVSLSLDRIERPTLPTHFLLTSEVKKPEDLEHANFYLGDGPEAAQSLDLLLGTQGWRRFMSGSSEQPNVDFREQLVRLLRLDGNPNIDHEATFQSAATQAQRWSQYRDAVSSIWRVVVLQTRVFLSVIIVLWAISVAIRMRRLHRVRYVAGLLMVASSLAFYGCGSSSSNTVVSSEELRQFANENKAFADSQRGASASKAEIAQPQAQVVSQGIDLLLRGLSPNSETLAELQQNRRDRGQAIEALAGQTLSPEQLEQLLASRGLDAESIADQLLDELRFPIRQYAHVHSAPDTGLREDFAETLYWQPLIITDSDGRASMRFDLSDAVTTFRVGIDAHSESGRIGSFSGKITSRLPFQLEPKLPLEVTAGDRIDLPIGIINSTKENVGVELAVDTDSSLVIAGDANRSVTLPASQRSRELVSMSVPAGTAEQDASITVRGVGQNVTDSVRRTLHISPSGYPASQSISGRVTERETVQLSLPKDIVDGSLAVTVRAYPSPIADVMSGIESILREPHGCFEQTSATNYPNAMALLYMQESQTQNPDITQRAMGMLDRGYAKLTGFECQQRGYEWFGSDPGHEALSAFGLMQFSDMAKVMVVNEEMMSRTRVWLMGRRDGNGGFKRNPRHLHVWSIQQEIVNAYVLWAITEADVASGQPHRATSELTSELDRLATVAESSNDPYLIALSAATLMNVGQSNIGENLLEKLSQLQHQDGSLRGATTVVSSGGLSLQMETTALAILAWVKSPRHSLQAQAAAKWITSNRVGAGGFGSTQATVLALKALVAMAGKSSNQTNGGTLQVKLAGDIIGEAQLPSDARSGSTVEITGLGQKIAASHIVSGLESGTLELELVALDANGLSFGIDVAYTALTPASDDNCPLKVSTRFSSKLDQPNTTTAGETLQVEMRLENITPQGYGMAVAMIGLPGGVEPRIDRLEELKTAASFDYYELRGREVILYWRTIEPNVTKTIEFDVIATVPGKYTGPASRAYLYYTAEQKHWTEPLEIEIQ